MARVPYLTKSDIPVEHHDLLDRNINFHKALAHSINGLRSFRGLGTYIRFKSKLDPRLREMVTLQVGYITRSAYEYSHHIKIGRSFGVSDDDIRAIIDESNGRPTSLDSLTKALLRATREMTNDFTVSDATFAELQKGLDNERLIDLVLTIGWFNCAVRMLATLRIDLEDEYKHFLEEFPLPKL